MHEGDAGRPPRQSAMPDQGAGGLQEHQRFLLRAEGEFAGVIRVVEAERDHGAHLDRRQPNHGVLGHDPAILEAQARVFRQPIERGRFVDGARIGDARPPHAASATNGLVRAPMPSISMRTAWPARTRGAGAAAPSASTSPGQRVMKSVTAASN